MPPLQLFRPFLRHSQEPASFPDVSLSMSICAQREDGKEITFLLSPSLGPSRFVTSHSRFVIALLYTGFATCLKFATFEFVTYILHSLPIGEVQNLLPRRGKRKRTKERVCR